MIMEAHSLYIHIPFCEKRCSYCDFNTYAGINYLIPAYVDAIIKEIEYYGNFLGHQVPVQTIFFGGGTPSLINREYYQKILDSIHKNFDTSAISEISLEANPGTVNLEYLISLQKIGFNRISFGVQSDHPKYLELMGRIHDYQDSILAVEWAKQAGFENLNIDLIYGIPDQTLNEWKQTLDTIERLKTQHVSLYALGIEEGTPLWSWVKDGLVKAPDDDLAASMYDYSKEFLESKNFYAYEISNFAISDAERDYRCLHNLQYWRNQPYLGIGAGAHGYVNNYRIENKCNVPAYIKSFIPENHKPEIFISPGIENYTRIDTFTEMQETLMVGLRLLQEGISIPKFKKRFKKSPLKVFEREFNELLSNRLVEIDENEIITISPDKIMVSNQVFRYFVN